MYIQHFSTVHSWDHHLFLQTLNLPAQIRSLLQLTTPGLLFCLNTPHKMWSGRLITLPSFQRHKSTVIFSLGKVALTRVQKLLLVWPNCLAMTHHWVYNNSIHCMPKGSVAPLGLPRFQRESRVILACHSICPCHPNRPALNHGLESWSATERAGELTFSRLKSKLL